MSISTSFLGIAGNLQSYEVGILIAVTIYSGIFLMLSNHHVFRPKVEDLFAQTSIQSKAIIQFTIDLISNLPQITFLTCTVAISNSDSGLSIIVSSDMIWSGLYLGLLAFRGLSSKELGNWKLILIKNIFFLGLIYITVALHYISQNYLFSLGATLSLIYFLNLIMEANEEKLVSIMEYLFNYRPQSTVGNEYQLTNKMTSLQYLAKNFTVSGEEVKEKMKVYQKDLKGIKIKTKSLVAQKLMNIAIAVHLSKLKMEAKAKRDIKNYYGAFNGTVAEKSKRIIVEKATFDEVLELQSDQKGEMVLGQETDSCIFYLFPVKIFESNKWLSIAFSLTINIGYGVLLSLTVFLTDNLNNGEYAHFLYGLLVLPFLPNVTKIEFFNSMAISSLWKYCIYGTILSLNCLSDSSSTFNLAISQQLTFTPLIQLIGLVLITYMVITSENCRYRLIFAGLTVILLNALFIFRLI